MRISDWSSDVCSSDLDVAKLRMIQDWMAGKGVIRANSHIRAYSDHVSDAPMLDFADEAYAANPHPPLAKLARERGSSEERRVGKECVSTCRSRGSAYN